MSPLQHSRAPDFAEAVVGYRAWDLAPGHKLGALAFATVHWTPGINKADCVLGGRGGGHQAPAPGCACGFNALHDPTDERLAATATRVIGAIACWGEVQVHATGLRSEYACVIALAMPARATPRQIGELEQVAARYEVALVPRGGLRAEAVRHARPLPAQFLPRIQRPAAARRPAAGPGGPARRSRRSRRPGAQPTAPFGTSSATGRLRAPAPVLPRTGVWLDGHVGVKLEAGGALTIGASRALGALLEPPCRTLTVAPGSQVLEGDALAVVRGRGEPTVIAAPCDGRVDQVNRKLHHDPAAIHSDPAGAGWVVRLKVDDRALEDSPIVWDREGHEAYRAHVQAAGDDEALLGSISLGRHLAWSDIAGFGELAVVIRLRGPQASLHPIPDGNAVRALGERLCEWTAAEPSLRASFEQLGLAMRIVVSDRDGAELTLPSADSPALTLRMSADSLHAYWSGDLDLGRAIGDGDIVLAAGDRGDALIANSLCQRLFARYRQHIALEQSPRRRALRALDDRGAA